MQIIKKNNNTLKVFIHGDKKTPHLKRQGVRRLWFRLLNFESNTFSDLEGHISNVGVNCSADPSANTQANYFA